MEKYTFDALLVLLGWGLGLIPTILMFLHNERKGIADFKAGLKVELTEVRSMLMMTCYTLSSKKGQLTRELLKESYNILSERENEFTGHASLEAIQKILARISEMADEEAARVLSSYRGENGARFNLKHFDISYLKNNVDKVPRLHSKIQKIIITILQKINQINEEIDYYQESKTLTFSASSEANHVILNRNMDSSEELIAKKSRIISKLISELLDMLND